MIDPKSYGSRIVLANEEQISNLEDMFAAMYQHFFEANGITRLPENGFERWMKGYSRSRDISRSVFICFDGEKPVGMIEGQIKIGGVTSGLGKIGNVSHLFVLPLYRKTGLARKLYETQAEWFIAKKVRNFDLEVVFGNEGALAFWKAVGFRSSFVSLVKSVDTL